MPVTKYLKLDALSNIMKKKIKKLVSVFGVICIVSGGIGAIPSFLREMYGYAIASGVLIILGIILFAIAFGD